MRNSNVPFYLEVSMSNVSGEQWVALTHLTDGLANLLNKTAEINDKLHLGKVN